MCGIVGIVGTQPVAERLVDALKRLEYRGYDSAGVATIHDGAMDRRRAEGKLFNLEKKLSEEPLPGITGIAHTPGQRMGFRTKPMPIRTSSMALPSCITASSRISRNCVRS